MSTRYNHGSHYENHQRAAELHEAAAHAHHRAAAAHENQDHQTAKEQSKQAFEHSERAYEHTTNMERGAVNEYGVAIFGHADIAKLAYELWQARGCPQGSPEEDWFHAARELRARGEALLK
jgi:hypothetical protein